MTVPAQRPSTAHVGNAVTTVFPYTFLLFDADDLKVMLNGAFLVRGPDYTVSGLNSETGGNVTFTTPPEAGVQITLFRAVILKRDTNYQYQGDFQSLTVNRDFDRTVQMIQDATLSVEGALRYPPGDLSSAFLPDATTRALKSMSFDEAGNLKLVNSTGDAIALAISLASSAGGSMVFYKLPSIGSIVRSLLSKLAEQVSITDFGAVSGTNCAVAIQKAIDAAYLAGGGTVWIPPGNWLIEQTLILKYRVNLRGYGNKNNNCSILRAAPGLNGPVLTNDLVNGIVIGNGEDGQPQRINSSSVVGVAIFNRNVASSADAVRLRNCWTFDFIDCYVISDYGFSFNLLDCNAIHILDSFYGPSFAYSVADSYFTGSQVGPRDAPAVDAGWVTSIWWFSGVVCWKNKIVDNFIYNGANGRVVPFTVTPGDSNISAPSHQYYTGQPVIIETVPGGSVPTGLISAENTGWITVVDANTVKLSSSFANWNNGFFLTPTTIGAGDLNFRVGGRANLFLNDGAQENVISGRFDQGYWSGIAFRRASRNNVTGSNISENGRANPVGQPGISVGPFSNDNLLDGLTIDGFITGTATGTTNQSVGVQISSIAERTALGTNKIINHAGANVVDNSVSTQYPLPSRFISTRGFSASTGTPTVVQLTGNRRDAWAFDPNTDQQIQAWEGLPNGPIAWAVELSWTNLGAGGGSVVWAIQYESYFPGTDMAAAEPAGALLSITQVAPSQNVLAAAKFTATIPSTPGAHLMSLRVKRVATDAADTLPNNAGVVGLLLRPVF